MITGWDRFITEVGGIDCQNIKFRPGAQESDAFGLECRYRIIDQATEWGWPGIHWGVDRGGTQNKTVYLPLEGDVVFIDTGKDSVYGSEVVLRHWSGFYVRIAHMLPDRVAQRIRVGGFIAAGYPIGPIGDYGQAIGEHTHVELESAGGSCSILEEMILRRFGSQILAEYTSDEVVAKYAACEKTRSWSADECLRDWVRLKDQKGVTFANKWLIRRKWRRSVPEGQDASTVYSSLLALDF